jgi:hypothetical protein
VEDDEASGTVPVPKGMYKVKWSCRNLSSFRTTRLEYTVTYSEDDMPMKLDSAIDLPWLDTVRSFEDEFFDALSPTSKWSKNESPWL